MNKFIATFQLIISCTSILLTFYTVVELMLFLSTSQHDFSNRPIDWIEMSRKLFINMLLISGFVFQHSFLALPQVKNTFKKTSVQAFHRTVYNTTTCIVLQLLMNNWSFIDNYVIWSINAKHGVQWWIFSFIHVVSWLVIYVGCICMDINELLGIKQVYYNIKSLPSPNSMKSEELRRLYSHMRHPSFVAFIVIFWVTPLMTLDRCLLSVIVTLYMFISWKNDESDYQYQKYQYLRKYYELNHID